MISACSGLVPAATPTPTADRAATAVAQATQDAQSTERIQATVEAVQAAAAAEVTEAAMTKAATTPTLRPMRVTETAQAEQASGIVESLFDAGYISTTKGENLPLDRFFDQVAKINYFYWTYMDYAPSDFVFRADLEWQSASDVANWFNSGCGIVFREDGIGENFYVVFLNLDGTVELMSWQNDVRQEVVNEYYGRLDIPDGEGELIVTAEGDHIQVFVNSKLVVDVRDTRHTEGEFALTVISGTNKGFGTRCTFDNITLWELDVEE